MSWNSQAAQIATANPATAIRLSTATPAIATHLSRGRSNGLTASRGAPPLERRSSRLRMRRQRALGRRRYAARARPWRFGTHLRRESVMLFLRLENARHVGGRGYQARSERRRAAVARPAAADEIGRAHV